MTTIATSMSGVLSADVEMDEGRSVGGERVTDQARQVSRRRGAHPTGTHCNRECGQVRRAQFDADRRDPPGRLLVADLLIAAVVDDDHRDRKSLLGKRYQLLDGEHQRAVAQ